jgi:protein-S-isoprenylcysteine O-methyltransferase Ste14
VIGLLLFVPGVYLSIVSNAALNRLGHGAAAFKLTKAVVQSAIYERTRNPMSLGYYLAALGIGLLAGSTYLTCVALFFLIPAHAFNLKFFEELELELRYGQSYREYKKRVSFLIPSFHATAKTAQSCTSKVRAGGVGVPRSE